MRVCEQMFMAHLLTLGLEIKALIKPGNGNPKKFGGVIISNQTHHTYVLNNPALQQIYSWILGYAPLVLGNDEHSARNSVFLLHITAIAV